MTVEDGVEIGDRMSGDHSVATSHASSVLSNQVGEMI